MDAEGRRRAYLLPGSIVLAAVIVALSFAGGRRYESRDVANVLWVTDRLTGHVTICSYPTDSGGAPACRRLRPAPDAVAYLEGRA